MDETDETDERNESGQFFHEFFHGRMGSHGDSIAPCRTLSHRDGRLTGRDGSARSERLAATTDVITNAITNGN